MGEYLFDQAWTQEKRRLDALAEMYDPGTIAHLTRLGVGAGWRCLEVGAGTGTIATWMAAQVGDRGAVIATDTDPRFLAQLGPGIEVRRHDIASDPLEDGGYDLIHTRAVLEHVPQRGEALARMVRALRPGGCLLLEEIVMPPDNCSPALPVLRRILSGMEQALRRSGADPEVGLWLHDAMIGAGLTGVTCEARVPMVYSGHRSIEFVILSLEQVGSRMVEAGLFSADDLAEGLAAFRAPGHTMLAAIMIAAWGKAPT